LRSDRSFFAFLSGGGARRLVPILLVGLLLFGAAGLIFGEGESEAVVLGEEDRLCSAIEAVSGVGRCRVMTTEGKDGEISAVVVLCDGAESAAVRDRLTELISSLYGIRSSRIAILKLE
jgi:hypothetical protein